MNLNPLSLGINKSGLGGGGFNPSWLFPSGTSGFFLDPLEYAAFNNLRTTSGGSTLADDPSDPIGQMIRISGSFDWTQGTSGLRGTLARFPANGIRNRLSYTEDVSNAAWTKTNMTASTAVLLLETATTTSHLIERTAIPLDSAVTNTLSFKIKGQGRDYSYVRWGDNAIANRGQASLDLVTGTVTLIQNIGTATGAACTMTAAEDGYWLVTISVDPNTAASTMRLIIYSGNAANYQGAAFLGDVTKGIYVKELQAESGGTRSAYQKVVGFDDVTQSGQPSRYLPYSNGSQWWTSGTQTFGTASLFAANTQAWTVWGVFRCLVNGTLLAKSSGTAANITFLLLVAASGTLGLRCRGTLTDTGVNVMDGVFHTYCIRWNGTTLTLQIDSSAAVTIPVGTAVEEAQNITLSVRTEGTPAAILAGHNYANMVDYAVSDAQRTQLMAYLNSYYRSGL